MARPGLPQPGESSRTSGRALASTLVLILEEAFEESIYSLRPLGRVGHRLGERGHDTRAILIRRQVPQQGGGGRGVVGWHLKEKTHIFTVSEKSRGDPRALSRRCGFSASAAQSMCVCDALRIFSFGVVYCGLGSLPR